MEIAICVIQVLGLISLIAIPFLHRANEKKERMELFSCWEKWMLEDEAKEYLDTMCQKVNKTVENKLEEMFQAE